MRPVPELPDKDVTFAAAAPNGAFPSAFNKGWVFRELLSLTAIEGLCRGSEKKWRTRQYPFYILVPPALKF